MLANLKKGEREKKTIIEEWITTMGKQLKPVNSMDKNRAKDDEKYWGKYLKSVLRAQGTMESISLQADMTL